MPKRIHKIQGISLGAASSNTRYGRKEDKNRSDLLKLIHYGIIALHVNDLEGEK